MHFAMAALGSGHESPTPKFFSSRFGARKSANEFLNGRKSPLAIEKQLSQDF